MAAYDLEEQEQIAELKAWWAQYGNLVVSVLLALVLGFAGWQGWNWYRNAGDKEASAMFFNLQQAVMSDDAVLARKVADDLISKHGGMVQAQMGALLSAGMQIQKNDLDNAFPHLEWVADKGKDAILRDFARLRLAAVLMDQHKADQALLRLQPVPEGHLRARFEDLRGDAFASQGKTAEALSAWKTASDALGNSGNDAVMSDAIRVKIETLKGWKAE